ncbi:MAG: FAD:protein FMN transferase, partial [Firmicutes bacterium]|nr:FAD:protein FMN transferase [Bacillota bacterium]
MIAPSSAHADALSTTCFALGFEEGLKLINETDGIEAIFITDDMQYH